MAEESMVFDEIRRIGVFKKGLPMNSQEIQQQAGHIWKKNQKR
jgi:hypothetical protein